MDHFQFEFDHRNFLKIGNFSLNNFVKNCVTNSDENKISLKTDSNEILIETSKFSTPFFLYSKNRLICNFLKYKNSFNEILTFKHGIQTEISYALKANFNPSILKLFYDLGSWCSLVKRFFLIFICCLLTRLISS
jgi:hypothetical protein